MIVERTTNGYERSYGAKYPLTLPGTLYVRPTYRARRFQSAGMLRFFAAAKQLGADFWVFEGVIDGWD